MMLLITAVLGLIPLLVAALFARILGKEDPMTHDRLVIWPSLAERRPA